MTAAEVSLAGHRVVSGSIELPAYGLWAADVMLADDEPLPASAPLVVGDLTLQSYAYRSYAFAGNRKSRLVGGFSGGWMRSVGALEYVNPPGLTLSLVLSDMASTVGERVNVVTDQTFGSFFFRRGTGASKRALDQLVGRTWWIDPTGVVQVGAVRSALAISSAFTVNDYVGAEGRAIISTESPSDWMPGRTWTSPAVTTPQTISSVRHSVADGKLRTEVLGAGPEGDRMIGPLAELVEDLAPDPTYSGVWEYAVQDTDGKVVSCNPTTATVLAAPFPLPTHVTGVVMRPGLPGCSVKPGVGSLVYVTFANGDPSRPLILSYDTNSAQSVGFDCGTGTAEHMMTSEAVLGLMGTMLTALAPSLTSPSPPDTVLAAAVAAAESQNLASALPTSYAALLVALALKSGDTGGTVPNLGCKNIRGG